MQGYTRGMPEHPPPWETLPLFPLNTVLFPGGELHLRIFEARYLDLVRDCTREDRGFGVCLIVEGREAGAPATPAAFGTEARITDFDGTPDGLLGIRVHGERRFRVVHSRVRDNGLVVGDVEWLAQERVAPLHPEHGLLATLLARLLDAIGGAQAQIAQASLDDAAWVGWRLAELLPLAPAARQLLLQEDDPHARLDRLLEAIPQIQRD